MWRREPQALFYVSDRIKRRRQTIYKKFILAALERGKYLIPFRTQKSSLSSPMVLHTRVWESRSLPSLSSAFKDSSLKALFFANFFIDKIFINREAVKACSPM